jgi:CubicO group peptidase (beta-lactamase class C family)
MISGRRSAMRIVAALAVAALAACGSNPGEPTPPNVPDAMPLSGTAVPGMASVDSVITELMTRWDIPGGAVGIVRDGRLVYARGFGYSDVASETVTRPDDMFRLASVSKPVTAVAILRLVEEGRLSLDEPAFALLPDLTPLPGATVDPRLASVTVRHLLEHSGGWDRALSFDPMFRPTEIAAATGTPAPASAEAIVRYMLGQPLDFDPGTRYAYSNFGYAVLGRIIERITGASYEGFVQEAVLAPAGVTRMRLGRSLLADRAPGEVRYYDPATVSAVFPGAGAVPLPYGGFNIEAMDAHGGWIASTVDLLRFETAVDLLPSRPDVLTPASIGLMTAKPASPLWDGSPVHYALGWLVHPVEGNWWHGGSLPGTATIMVRTGTKLAWVALFNAHPTMPNATIEAELDDAMWEAVNGVTAWPAHDLFETFP